MPPLTDPRLTIIGGGIAGYSIAYYLARLGQTDVLYDPWGERLRQ